MDLEEYRAIKQVPKSCMDYERFRREALILKGIRHPGIPIVYDLVDTQEHSYLIEEFVEGETLYALVSDMGHFSTAMTIRYGIQICHLVNILHSARPTPILYLDLQPKNLLLCHDLVKLVDFDHAVHLDEAERLTLRYGTVGCAAPEQYTGEVLDERTDIYAIGAVLCYMLTGQYPNMRAAQTRRNDAAMQNMDPAGRNLKRVIRRCLSEDKEKRYQSVEQLCQALTEAEEQIRNRNGCGRKNQTGECSQSSLRIAVAGSRPGAGTTHIAIGLTAYLRKSGISAMYREENDSGAVCQLASWAQVRRGESGIFLIRGIPMLPQYGESVSLPEPGYPVQVVDCGADWQRLSETWADAGILVCGAKPWERGASGEAMLSSGVHPELAVIFNHFCGQLHGRLPGQAREITCFLMPE